MTQQQTMATDASGGRGSSLPRTPTNVVAPAGLPEYSQPTAATVGRASTPRSRTVLRRSTAGDGGGAALQALPARSALPAVDRILVGARGSELPRPAAGGSEYGSVTTHGRGLRGG